MSIPRKPTEPSSAKTSLLDACADYVEHSSAWLQAWWTRHGGAASVARLQSKRLGDLVRFARSNSPLYRELYRLQPANVSSTASLPVTTKRQLMARFNDWVTDPEIRKVSVEAFLADRKNVGDRFLGRYVVWKSSGTTGVPGIFLQDDHTLGIYDTLLAVQLASPELALRYASTSISRGGRSALVSATGDHFASIAFWKRMCRSNPRVENRALSIMEPLERIVAELNAFQPVYLASYPTMLALLADEKSAGRLRISPALVWSGGEFMSQTVRTRIEEAFGCPTMNEYGSSECMSIACSCREGWLHVNSDWVLLEPVDAGFRPTPPGRIPHTVLLTNLANHLQPIIRYNLGDAVLVKPDPCACGNPLPAIRVEGRCEDIVTLSAGGSAVRVLPMALTTVVEEEGGINRFQIVQTGGDRLALRIDVPPEERESRFRIAAEALRAYLVRQGIPDPKVELDESLPVVEPKSGKLRQVVVDQEYAQRREPPATQ